MEREGKKRRLEGEELSSGARDIHSKRNHMKLAAHRHQHDAAHRPGHCVDNEDGGQGREEWRKKADRKRQRKLEREKRKALRKGLADESFSVDRAAPIRLDSEDSAKAGAVCRGGGESHAAAGRAETGKKKGKRRRPAEQDREGRCPQVAESRRERTDDETRHECSDNGAAQGEFPFAVSAEADHAETPLQAYADIASVLRIVAENLGKDARDLKIYDPYFCAGTMKEHMRAVGFPCVYNRKEDFYQVVKNGAVPEHDVVVTNPPYSLDHVQRIIRWLVRNGKPWFLLVPNYVYMKDYYLEALGASRNRVMYLTPPARYIYQAPPRVTDGHGKMRKAGDRKTAPFPSFWYLDPEPALTAHSLLLAWRERRLGAASNCQLCLGTRQLPHKMRDAFDPLRKKLSKREREKMRKKTAADGRKLCKQCGQVHGLCKHTRPVST